MFKLLTAFVMAIAIAGTAPAFANDHVKVKRDQQYRVEQNHRDHSVRIGRDNWPVGQDRYPQNARERFLNDYHWCDRNFACGGAD